MSINTEMTALADAIRNKSGVTGKLSIAAMTSAVGNIVINPGGGETVDLSFVTATAGDILSGKVGADKNGNPVHGTLELTGGSDIDLSGVTVTADTMLAGIVAVGADGQKVTGNIQTVAASSDGEYVTIPAGFHASEQRFPINISGDGGYDTSIVTATAETMLSGTIAIGRNGETIVGNIQTVTPVVTETSVTIEPGYVGETLNFEIGGSSGEGEDSVVFGYLDKNGMFQALDLSGDAPVKVGEPEEIDKFTTFSIPEISNPLRLSLKNSTGSASVHMVLASDSNNYYNYLDNSIYYRTQDNRNWRLLEVDATNIKKSKTINLSANNTYVEFWGKSSTLSVSYGRYYNFIMSGSDIEASGSVMSLINNNELYEYCFIRLFEDCTNLTSAPELPAMQLAEHCYMAMFEGCTNLVSAPELPATQLAEGCYYTMFADCTKLKSIKVHFSSWETDNNSTYEWVRGVANSGNFYKPSNLATSYGINYIPANWVVHDID